jgi:hypothetical protein
MLAGQKAAIDDVGFEVPEGSDFSHHHGHGHEGAHHGGDPAGHDSGDFHLSDHGGFDAGVRASLNLDS